MRHENASFYSFLASFGIRGKVSHIPRSTARIARMMVCSTLTPAALAMAPTAKGRTAAPPIPMAAVKLILKHLILLAFNYPNGFYERLSIFSSSGNAN